CAPARAARRSRSSCRRKRLAPGVRGERTCRTLPRGGAIRLEQPLSGYRQTPMTEQPALVLVSNRGPVTYQDDGPGKRGTGGLVTALTGLASHRDAIWIASAMTSQDVEVAREHGGKPFEVSAPEGGSFRVRFVESDDEAYDRFYNIIANPMLWFI